MSEMTNEQIDAEIAEKVMGIRVWKEKRGEYELCVKQFSDGREPWKSSRGDNAHRYTQVTAAEAIQIGWFADGFDKYSSSWSAAAMVLAEIDKRGLSWQIDNTGFNCPDQPDIHGKYRVLIGWGDDHVSGCAEDDSAPRAICLAALAALAAERNQK